jgi:hypothetical protein
MCAKKHTKMPLLSSWNRTRDSLHLLKRNVTPAIATRLALLIGHRTAHECSDGLGRPKGACSVPAEISPVVAGTAYDGCEFNSSTKRATSTGLAKWSSNPAVSAFARSSA